MMRSMYPSVPLEKDSPMHPTPSRTSRLARALAACAAIAVLASGIGLTTGTAAHAETAITVPAKGISEAPGTEAFQADFPASDTFQESPETSETPESAEPSAPPIDDEDPAGSTPTPTEPGAPPTPEPGTTEPDEAEIVEEETVEEAPTPDPTPATDPTPNSAPQPITSGTSESTATSLALGQTVTGSLSKAFFDRRYYRLRAPSDGRMNVKFTFPSSVSGDAFVVTLRSATSKNEYRYSFNGGDAAGKSTAIPAALIPQGDFYAVIESRSSATVGITYALTVTHSPLSQVEREDNNYATQANFITAGKSVYGSSRSPYNDGDWFVMNTPQAGNGRLKFTFPKNLAGEAFEVKVFNAAQKEIVKFRLNGGDSDGASIAKQNIKLPKGQVFVYVRGLGPSLGQPYQLTLGMTLTTAAPTISGKLSPGATLTAKPGKWGPGSVKFAYQWKRDGTAISGAQKSTYKVTKSDVGRNLTVTVTGSSAGIGSESRTSAKKYVPTTFIDVPRSQKFYSEIQWMYDTKRTTGVKTSRGLAYQPKSGVTREAMAAFIFRQEAKKSYQAPKKSPFRDVSPGDKFYREIAWMYEQGISTGTKTSSGRVYKPKQHVTREAMAAFLFRLRAPSNTKAPSQAPFADVPATHKFGREIAWMKTSKLSTGTKRGGTVVYEPKNTVTREAMAAFLFRMDRSVPKKPTTKPKTPATTKNLTVGAPSISGNGRPGHTLTANTGTWAPAPVTLKYQWLRNGTPISGATGKSYSVRLGDGRQNISVTVTGSKSGYRTASRSSGTVWVAPDLGDSLVPGQTLPNDFYLQSGNGRYRLVMQSDGNLVAVDNGRGYWSTHTAGRGAGTSLSMQGDGNAVLYANGRAVWSTKTNGKGGHRFTIQNDGNVVLYNAQGRAIWDRITKG